MTYRFNLPELNFEPTHDMLGTLEILAIVVIILSGFMAAATLNFVAVCGWAVALIWILSSRMWRKEVQKLSGDD